jgi:small subunit ribosomal protein S13
MRIAGVNIPDGKAAFVALTYIYGVGVSTARDICRSIGAHPDTKLKDLSEGQVEQIRSIIGEKTVEGELRNIVSKNIQDMQAVLCYKGIRHRVGLPVRGQRTKTNAKTRRRLKHKI